MNEEEHAHKSMARYYSGAVVSVLAAIAAASWTAYLLAAVFLAVALVAAILAMRAQVHLDHIYDHLDDEHTETYPSLERFMEAEAPNYEG